MSDFVYLFFTVYGLGVAAFLTVALVRDRKQMRTTENQ
jgi:hypothetical protein